MAGVVSRTVILLLVLVAELGAGAAWAGASPHFNLTLLQSWGLTITTTTTRPLRSCPGRKLKLRGLTRATSPCWRVCGRASAALPVPPTSTWGRSGEAEGPRAAAKRR